MSMKANKTKIKTAAKAEVTSNAIAAIKGSDGANNTIASAPKTRAPARKARPYVLKPSKVRAQISEPAQPLAASSLAPYAQRTAAPKVVHSQGLIIPAATAASASSTTKADIIYLGMDVHADRQVIVVQVDATTPKPAQSMDIKALHVFAKKQRTLAHRVVACYEAGPCGYSLCRTLIALGIECMVVRPKCWDEFGSKVKTDARDARQLCEALERYTKGNINALSVVRLPTEAEELQRGITRQRDALVSTRMRTAAQGRSAVLFTAHSQRMKGQWWKPRAWARWEKALSAVLVEMLLPLHRVLVIIDEQIEQLTERIEAAAQERITRSILPKGVGELTSEVIAREVCDWSRFKNRRQVASFTGLCPTEYSSGGTRRQGGISKHGNPLLRKYLCETVWRLMKYQPGWIRLQAFAEKLAAASGARRKQLVAALARMLAIDLWRLNTGRSSLEALGFVAAAAVTA
jgi:transposase